MSVPILMVVFSNWLQQESVPDRISMGVITLLKKDKYGGVGIRRLGTHNSVKNRVKDFGEDPDGAFSVSFRDTVGAVQINLYISPRHSTGSG